MTILGVDGEGLGRVLGVRAFEGVPYNEQVGYMQWLAGEWHFRRVYVDASAHALVDETAKVDEASRRTCVHCGLEIEGSIT